MEELRITLAAARVNAGMTQEDVCKEIHVTKNTLVNWEKYATQPRIDQAELLSKLYKIPYQNIIFVRPRTN